MSRARLSITDLAGARLVTIEQSPFTIGRRDVHHLTLTAADASRDHAEIIRTDDQHLVRDLGSRGGTFVNGLPIAQQPLRHGDRLRFGQGDLEAVFLIEDDDRLAELPAASAALELRRMAALLATLQSLGGRRIVEDVLDIVLDAAIDASGAGRGFILLADASGRLEWKAARAAGHVSLSGQPFATSRRLPEEVFATGEPRLVRDLLDGDLAALHEGTIAAGIRHVLCVPLTVAHYHETAGGRAEPARIGVLYVDSHERGGLLSPAVVTALEMLAREAAVAIEQARLYREAEAKARLDRELAIAAEIQQALLPASRRTGAYFEAVGISVACRSIGGDFFDYLDQPDGAFGFVLSDVAGKGPPAALLTAMLQGMLIAHAGSAGPAEIMHRMNAGLIRRGVSARYATAFYGVLAPDGRLTYCNAGHNPPLLFDDRGIRRLETGGTVVGLLSNAEYEEETIVLTPGSVIALFSDGISEAFDVHGEEFGELRIEEALRTSRERSIAEVLDHLLRSVRAFSAGAEQSDDQTVVLVRYAHNPSIPA